MFSWFRRSTPAATPADEPTNEPGGALNHFFSPRIDLDENQNQNQNQNEQQVERSTPVSSFATVTSAIAVPGPIKQVPLIHTVRLVPDCIYRPSSKTKNATCAHCGGLPIAHQKFADDDTTDGEKENTTNISGSDPGSVPDNLSTTSVEPISPTSVASSSSSKTPHSTKSNSTPASSSSPSLRHNNLPVSPPRSPGAASSGSITPPPESVSTAPGELDPSSSSIDPTSPSGTSISPGASPQHSQSAAGDLPSQDDSKQQWLDRKKEKYSKNGGVWAKRNCCF